MSMSRIAWLLCILLLPALASASADKKPEESSRGFGYIEMSPAFIVNVGDGKRMAFLKTDVSLRAIRRRQTPSGSTCRRCAIS